MTVLILSNLEDVHARAVMGALAAQGAHAELVDLSEFPTRLALSLAFEDGRRRFQLRRLGGGALDLATVESVWWRRPQPFSPPAGLDEAGFRLSMSESRTAFQGLYQALEARWINEPARDAVASHKAYQLALAQEIGLAIPPTLMTNDVEGAKAFWRRYEGEVIYKQFFALPEAWRETRRLRPEDEAQAAAVAHAPVIFQKHVPAVADLRVVVVAGELFAASADVRNAEYPQDVRMNLSAKYEPHDLPPQIAAKLSELMRRSMARSTSGSRPKANTCFWRSIRPASSSMSSTPRGSPSPPRWRKPSLKGRLWLGRPIPPVCLRQGVQARRRRVEAAGRLLSAREKPQMAEVEGSHSLCLAALGKLAQNWQPDSGLLLGAEKVNARPILARGTPAIAAKSGHCRAIVGEKSTSAKS